MNTFKRVNLTQLQPCQQAWEDMKPLEQGRLCQQCNKVLIDFRKKSDREIAEIHAFSKEPVCGLYIPQQRKLSRPASEFVSKPVSWKAATLGALSLLFSEQVQAQAPVAAPETEQRTPETEAQPVALIAQEIQSPPATIYLSGRLYDEESMPVPFGMVVLPNLQIGTSTDVDGYFQLTIPKTADAPDMLSIRFNYLGYGDLTTQIPFVDTQNYVATFPEKQQLSVFYITVRQPLHKRVWQRIKGIFRKNK